MYELISFVSRGKIRRKVLEQLSTPKTPTQLSNIISTQRPTISRTISDLQSKGLVECLTPNEKMGRYYQITALGKKILETLIKISPEGRKKR
jgi:ArsR family transcriptional regulator, cadmium/lead-responsive transcriptional repressor